MLKFCCSCGKTSMGGDIVKEHLAEKGLCEKNEIKMTADLMETWKST